MMTSSFSASLAICAGNSPVSGEFPAQRPVTRSFDVFFDSRLNKRLSKQSWGWWFETPSNSLWRHCNAYPNFSSPYLHHVWRRWGQRCWCCHYSDVTWALWRPKSQLVHANNNDRISTLLVLCEGNPPAMIMMIPHKRPVMRETLPYHDIILHVCGVYGAGDSGDANKDEQDKLNLKKTLFTWWSGCKVATLTPGNVAGCGSWFTTTKTWGLFQKQKLFSAIMKNKKQNLIPLSLNRA